MVATTSFGQIKVFSDGTSMVGDNTGFTVADEEFQVIGDSKQEGAIVERTGASASALFNRTDAAAFAMGAGVQAGFTWDQAFNFEWRTQPRASIINRSVSTGTLVFKMMGATGNLGIGRNQPQQKLDVNGSIRYNGSLIVASDKRLKNNVAEFSLGLDEVLALNPISYDYTGAAGLNNDGNRPHIGLIAQELQKVAPELVSTFDYTDEASGSTESYLQIDESALKFMIINAMKEQQGLIDAQAEKIAQLEEAINTIGATEINNRTSVTISSYDLAELGQNSPNPFNGFTNISYVIPTNATSAQIAIFGTSGQLLKTLDIDHTGEGTLEVNAQDLPSGTYSYQLIVDNKSVKSSKMVLSK